jgi:stage V sporulation protein SpoVS
MPEEMAGAGMLGGLTWAVVEVEVVTVGVGAVDVSAKAFVLTTA